MFPHYVDTYVKDIRSLIHPVYKMYMLWPKYALEYSATVVLKPESIQHNISTHWCPHVIVYFGSRICVIADHRGITNVQHSTPNPRWNPTSAHIARNSTRNVSHQWLLGTLYRHTSTPLSATTSFALSLSHFCPSFYYAHDEIPFCWLLVELLPRSP